MVHRPGIEPAQLLGRQLCSPLYHRRYMKILISISLLGHRDRKLYLRNNSLTIYFLFTFGFLPNVYPLVMIAKQRRSVLTKQHCQFENSIQSRVEGSLTNASVVQLTWVGFPADKALFFRYLLFFKTDLIPLTFMLRNGSKKEDTYQQNKTFEFRHQISFLRYRSSIKPYTTGPGKITHAQAHIRQYKAPD